MNENKDKQIFTLDVVSSIDEDILDKNLKKRFALWKRRGKRRYLRVIPIIDAALCLCIGLGATVSFLFRGDEKQVPVYRGMTVSHDVPSAEEGAPSLSDAAAENTALPTYLSRSALSLTAMPLSGTADADETSLPMLLDNDKNKNKEKDKSDSPEIVFGETYYAMKNEDIYIHIHLDNQKVFSLLSGKNRAIMSTLYSVITQR